MTYFIKYLINTWSILYIIRTEIIISGVKRAGEPSKFSMVRTGYYGIIQIYFPWVLEESNTANGHGVHS